MPCPCAILSCVACPLYHIVPHFLINGTNFWKKNLLKVKCLFWISKQILSEKFVILGRAEWDIITNVLEYIQYIKYSVDFAHILSFCNASCGSAENMMTTTMSQRISQNSYFWISLKNPPLVTVQQYFCTLSPVQAATQHVKSTVQKSPCMLFHWTGGTVTVVKHKMWHCVVGKEE
jgi:hypothetical protein